MEDLVLRRTFVVPRYRWEGHLNDQTESRKFQSPCTPAKMYMDKVLCTAVCTRSSQTQVDDRQIITVCLKFVRTEKSAFTVVWSNDCLEQRQKDTVSRGLDNAVSKVWLQFKINVVDSYNYITFESTSAAASESLADGKIATDSDSALVYRAIISEDSMQLCILPSFHPLSSKTRRTPLWAH